MTNLLSFYDHFIIDLWGVMHDGTTLYPGAKETIEALSNAGKQIIFLSNAPRRAHKAADKLTQFGIPPERYLAMITSGEAGFQALKHAHSARSESDDAVHSNMFKWITSLHSRNVNYYYLGPSKDEDVLSELSGFEKSPAEEASFILCTGFEVDFQPVEEIQPTLKTLRSLDLPMVCINPDLEVVKQDGTQQLCAGYVARDYEAMGGIVTYFGKPHEAVYQLCFSEFEELGPFDPVKTLAIGDNLLTDIKGANQMGIDSLLITEGILKARMEHEGAEALYAETGARPTHVAASLAEAFL